MIRSPRDQGPYTPYLSVHLPGEHLLDSVVFIKYQSIPILTIPSPGDSRDSHIFTAWEVGFSLNFLCPGGRGFESEKFSTGFQRKMQELLDLFRRNCRQLVFLCCFRSIFAKTVDVYCICNNRDHFSSIRSF